MLSKPTELYSPLHRTVNTPSSLHLLSQQVCTSTDQCGEFHNNQQYHKALQPGKNPDIHMFIELFN